MKRDALYEKGKRRGDKGGVDAPYLFAMMDTYRHHRDNKDAFVHIRKEFDGMYLMHVASGVMRGLKIEQVNANYNCYINDEVVNATYKYKASKKPHTGLDALVEDIAWEIKEVTG